MPSWPISKFEQEISWLLKRRRGPAYKALLIYQDIMPLGSAKKILEWVEAGLPVVIADGGKELISGTMQGVNLWKTNAKAAAYSPFNDQNDPNDSELATVMNQLRNHKAGFHFNSHIKVCALTLITGIYNYH